MARAKLLETSPFFESAHESASQGGQSAVPENVDVDTHFIAFIPQPVRAVLLLFPQRGALAQAREEEEKSDEHKFDGDVWWVKQTVSTRCLVRPA